MDINFVEKSFEDNGYTLLSKKYINAKTKMGYICPKEHRHSITWSDWKTGYRCPHCAGLAKLTLEQVRESFNKEDYTLLSKRYVNVYSKLEYRCPKGHEHAITWSGWKKGNRCLTCAGQIKPSLEFVIETFEKEGYTLLSKEYINSKTKLNYICPDNHKHSVSWCHWQEGIRCPTCASIKTSIRISGAGHSNWKGGISYEPYCPIWQDKEYKNDIKLRDGNKCLNPTCNKKDDRLHIHHIDYDKKNCSPYNLITLCGSCNAKANYDRDWHKTWYQAIIKNRYGGVTCL